MHVVAFNGSPRRNGNTARLIDHTFAALRAEGIETRVIPVGGLPLHGCKACFQCGQRKDGHCVQTEDAMNEWIDAMRGADGILLASPTYFADLTPELKALIDRAGFVSRANGGFLARKVGAAIVAVRRAGALHVFDSINHFFLINEMIVPGSTYWNIGVGRNPGDVENDEEGVRTMTRLGEAMAWVMKKVRA